MATIFMVIVGFFYYGIVRGRKLTFEGSLNSWKSMMMKKQGAPFYQNGSPFDLKISDFWPMLYPLLSLLGRYPEGRVHWSSCSRDVMPSSCIEGFSSFSSPRSLQYWAFCPTR